MKFFYLPPLAVGYHKLEDGKLALSFAKCSNNDVWSKEKARLICSGRMEKNKIKVINMPEHGKLYETLIEEAKLYGKKVEENYGSDQKVRV